MIIWEAFLEGKLKNTTELPQGYEEIYKINLQNDKKNVLFIHIISFGILILMIIVGMIFAPVLPTAFFNYHDGLIVCLEKLVLLLVGALLCMMLQILLNGICMHCLLKVNVHYGFTGIYLYSRADAYLNKKSYSLIALLPIVVLGIIILILNCLVVSSWFWYVYLIQIVNISGSFGNIYLVYKFHKLPKDILIKDDGVSMTAYSHTGH